MLNEIRHLLVETVVHFDAIRRDIHGRELSDDGTTHKARVIMSPGASLGPASRERMPDARATLWLVNHPRAIAIGDVFGLPDGERLKVIRAELRREASGTLHKVYLS